MKKLCCWIMIFVSIMTIAVSATAVTSHAESITASDYTANDLLAHFPFKNISYSYTSSDKSYSSSIDYSDVLLLQNSSTFSPELAKSSVALAMAAYSRSNVNSLLQNMGFKPYDNTYVYSRSANDLTLEDNDYVAYTISSKKLVHPYTNETYVVYAVPIQGTTANAEWFSNFNLGTGSEHRGFQKAATEVYQALQGFFDVDGSDAEHRIVWLTGHSRGAACANLVAGWLSSDSETYTTTENVFGYTFACPAVSLHADTTLSNIYNFNNDGDLVAKIPMANWQYKRYGQDITLNDSSLYYNNIKQRYKSVTGKDYAGMQTGDSYDAVLSSILGNNRDVYYESSSLQFVLALAGWGLGGRNDVGFDEVLNQYIEKNAADLVLETLQSYIGSTTVLDDIYSKLSSATTNKNGLAQWASDAYNATFEMSEEEFAGFLSSNSSQIAKLEKASGVGIETSDSFLQAYRELLGDSSKIQSVIDCVWAASELLAGGDGNALQKIVDGHCQATYVLWINSMYYGDRGWYTNHFIANADIPETITQIGPYAFYGCSSLSGVTIPSSVTSIGSYALYNCDNLKNISIPSSVTNIGSYAFADCDKLTVVTVPGSGVSVNDRTFANCTALQTVYVPDSAVFGYDVFYGDSIKLIVTLDKGVIPDDYMRSDYYTGAGFIAGYRQRIRGVNELEVAEGIKTIGANAFYQGYDHTDEENPKGFQKVLLPSTIITLGSHAFYQCDDIKEIVLPSSLTTVGSYAFYDCDGLMEIVLPSSLTTIDAYAFSHCDELMKIVLPSSLTSYGSFVFRDCYRLTEIVLLDGITAVGDGIFCGCSAVEYVIIPSSVTSIGGSAFSGCTKLKTVTIPGSGVSIGDRAFANCTALETAYMPDSAVFGYDVFYGDSTKLIVTFDQGIIGSGYLRSDNGNTSDKHRIRGISELEISEGITAIKPYAFYIQYSSSYEGSPVGVKKVILPSTLKSIGNYAFYDFDSITEIFLMEGLVNIGSYTFSRCDGLTEMVIPDGVTSIGSYAFSEGKALKKLTLPNGITSIPSYMCKGCIALEDIVVPSSVTSIGSYAFADCDKLTVVTVPGSCVTISDYAFSSCNALKTVYVPDSAILGNYVFSGVKLIITCDTGTIPSEYLCDNASYEHSKAGIQEIEISEGITAIELLPVKWTVK